MWERVSYPRVIGSTRAPSSAPLDVDVTEIIEIVAKQLDVAPEDVSAGSRLVEDLGARPLALAQMTLALEERFEIFIPDEDIADLVAVRDVLHYVEQLVGAARVH